MVADRCADCFLQVTELFGHPWMPACPEEKAYSPNGSRSLHGYLKEKHHMSVEDAAYVFSQLVAAVGHLHSKGFSHCDIKPRNILIDEKLKVSFPLDYIRHTSACR